MDEFLNAIQKTPVPTILILAGLFFLLLGFVTRIGGIIEVSPEQKRWTIPIGLLVFSIGLVIYFTPVSTVQVTPEKQTFPDPMYAGMRLDVCYEWANRCGQEPADEWCKLQGFNHALDFPTEVVGERGIPTKLIGTQQECRESFCGSFKYITCER